MKNLLPTGENPLPSLHEYTVTTEKDDAIYMDGYNAGFYNRTIQRNPYALHSTRYERWQTGFNAGVKARHDAH